MSNVSMKQLLEAGVHFGHQTRRWNPKMARYIYGERNGIYIVDLQKTVKKLKEATKFVKDTAAAGGRLVFIGTKKQAKDAIAEESARCGMYFVNQRWLGGTLTNFATIKKSIAHLKDLARKAEDGGLDTLPKKDKQHALKELEKLRRSIGGIQDMADLPDAIFVVDTKKEHNALLEARKLGIPIVGIVDTNCDPDEVDYIIPGNDDAIRAVRLIISLIADAVMEGKDVYQQAINQKLAAEQKAAGEAEAAAKGEGAAEAGGVAAETGTQAVEAGAAK